MLLGQLFVPPIRLKPYYPTSFIFFFLNVICPKFVPPTSSKFTIPTVGLMSDWVYRSTTEATRSISLPLQLSPVRLKLSKFPVKYVWHPTVYV